MRITRKQEDRFRVALFKTRFKFLADIISSGERFFQAIVDTSDDKIRIEEHFEIVEEWLVRYGTKKRKKDTLKELCHGKQD